MDDLGSVANVVDSTGTVKNSYRYDPFGNSTSKTEAVSNSWQFASGYLDANRILLTRRVSREGGFCNRNHQNIIVFTFLIEPFCKQVNNVRHGLTRKCMR